ncbi:MAG: TlpA family protein disulfide reductase [Pyrinomonadaceae bacterium]
MRIISVIALALALSTACFAQQALKRGDAAPAFDGQLPDGQMLTSADFQGKIVLVTFWSTRCQICHEEIPKLNQVADRYRGQDVVFVAVTMDNQAKVEAFVRKNPFHFSLLPNSFGVMLKYADRDARGNINMGFPAHFIIDRKGAIAARSFGWDKSNQLDSEIAKLLASE